MAKSHVFAFKGNIISPPAVIAVQGLGVKGGVLSQSGASWVSADGLVSFTPASGISVLNALLRQQGNIVDFVAQIALSADASAGTALTIGTLSGVPETENSQNTGIMRHWDTHSLHPLRATGTTLYLIPTVALSSGSGLAGEVTYSVAASGSVNPADSKTILVDNEDDAQGTVSQYLPKHYICKTDKDGNALSATDIPATGITIELGLHPEWGNPGMAVFSLTNNVYQGGMLQWSVYKAVGTSTGAQWNLALQPTAGNTTRDLAGAVLHVFVFPEDMPVTPNP